MADATRERRRELWRLIYLEGQSDAEVVERLAEQYDVPEETIQEDLETVAEWLPDFELPDKVDHFSLRQELRENRKRLHAMAQAAQEQGQLELELKIRREIRREVNTDMTLAEYVRDEEDARSKDMEELLEESRKIG